MILETFPVGPMACNCSIVACRQTKEAFVVDPGGDAELLLERIKALGVNVRYILITHAHFDHVIAARALKEATGATVCLHKKDIWLYRIMALQYRMGGVKERLPPRPDKFLQDGEHFAVGDLSMDVLHTPGHSPGSCSFHLSADRLLFSGDCLFRETFGQWKYPGGSFDSLVHSITEKLFLLPDDTRVIPGHGEETTIGHERQNNRLMQPDFIANTRATLAAQPGTMKRLWLMIWHMFAGK